MNEWEWQQQQQQQQQKQQQQQQQQLHQQQFQFPLSMAICVYYAVAVVAFAICFLAKIQDTRYKIRAHVRRVPCLPAWANNEHETLAGVFLVCFPWPKRCSSYSMRWPQFINKIHWSEATLLRCPFIFICVSKCAFVCECVWMCVFIIWIGLRIELSYAKPHHPLIPLMYTKYSTFFMTIFVLFISFFYQNVTNWIIIHAFPYE